MEEIEQCSILFYMFTKMNASSSSDIKNYQGEYICLTNKIVYLIYVVPGELIETHRMKLLELNIPIFKTLDRFRYEKLQDPTAEQMFHATSNFHTLKNQDARVSKICYP